MTTNVIENLNFSEYVEIDAVNSSRLKYLKHSLLAFKQNPQMKPTNSTDLGHVFHTLTLEPGEYADRYVSTDIRLDKRTKAYKELVEEHGETVQIIRSGTEELARKMCEDVLSDTNCAEVLRGAEVRNEVTVVTEIDGVKVKARFDAAGPMGIADLKSTKDPTPGGFPWESKRFGYFKQAAFYRMVLRAAQADGKLLYVGKDSYIVAAENTGQVICHVLYKLSEDVLDRFEAEIRGELEMLKEAFENDRFPGPGSDAAHLLDYPESGYSSDEDAVGLEIEEEIVI